MMQPDSRRGWWRRKASTSISAHNHVLRGVDLTVRKGEVVVIVGPSGSGKSTFLRTLNHLDAPDEGWVRIDGDLLGYRSGSGPWSRCPMRPCRSSDATSAWCSSSSTCSAT